MKILSFWTFTCTPSLYHSLDTGDYNSVTIYINSSRGSSTTAGRPVELTNAHQTRRSRPEGKRALMKCQEDVSRAKASFSLVQKASLGGETSGAIGTKELSDVWDARGAAFHPLVRCRIQDLSEP